MSVMGTHEQNYVCFLTVLLAGEQVLVGLFNCQPVLVRCTVNWVPSACTDGVLCVSDTYSSIVK